MSAPRPTRGGLVRGEVVRVVVQRQQSAEVLVVPGLAPKPEAQASAGAFYGPGKAHQAINLARATGRWLTAGAPVVSAEIEAKRAAACSSCELWDATACLGLGKCLACGCTGLKRWLATERCPHPQGSRWPA